jgi:acyl carrier protein
LPDDEYVAPRTPLEETLARIMAQVLNLERIGAEDDFFQLGAHSLLGAQVVARVRDEFGVELKLLDVFDAPTVAELAQKIEQSLAAQLASMSDAEVEAALARASDG